RCGRVKVGKIEVAEGVYRNRLDTPKTARSVRDVALPLELSMELEAWIATLQDSGPESWVFPSERGKTPLAKDNVWRRHIQPRLGPAGLGWVNFQVFRRTHASLMRAQNVDPKAVADNMGHSVDVNQNVYTQTPLGIRQQAVEKLAASVRVN
ncbi:MAG: tyrosine-type recombinase/integrase, partial [Bryobacteraceae bacterium]